MKAFSWNGKWARVCAAATAAFNVVMALNPVGLVIIAIAALAIGLVILYKRSETARRIMDGAFRAVARSIDFVRDHWKLFSVAFAILLGPLIGSIILLVTHFGKVKAAFQLVGTAVSTVWNSVIRPAFAAIVGTFLSVVGAIINGAAKAFGWVPGIGGKLKAAAREFNKFAASTNASLASIRDQTVTVNVLTKGTLPSGAIANAHGRMEFRAHGGPVSKDTPYVVGEGGPEVFVPDNSGVIVPNGASRVGAGLGGNVFNINVSGAIDPVATARQIRQLLLGLGSTTGVKMNFA